MVAESPTFGYMAVTDLESIASNWQLYKGFTVRPLPSTEDYCRSVVERFSTPEQNLMVYGGTPEIRTAIHDANRQAIIVDRSPTMVYAMGLLTSGGKSLLNRETIVQGDWLNVPLGPKIDLAFGDDAVNMMSWQDFGKYMAEANRFLARGGLYACHLLVQPDEEYRRQSAADVIREFEERKISSQYDLASRINFTFYVEESYKMGWQQSIAGLRKLLEAGKIGSDHGFIERFTNCGSVFACPPQKEWERLIDPMFSVEEIFYPKEYDYCRFEPLYLLRKR